ncbi:MAG: hypothetical protein R3C00_05740 [Hyphomonas sp.]
MTGSPPSIRGTDCWNAILAGLQAEWPGANLDLGAQADKLSVDMREFERKLTDGSDDTSLRLWDNERQLVISRRLSRLPGTEFATRWAEAHGFPVAVRASGGTAVVHRPGVLNISLIRVALQPLKLSQGFDELSDIVVRAAARSGIALTVGKLARSYCAGTHDIGLDGRKLAGTAAVSRRHGAAYGGLFHASLTVSGDWRHDLELISGFEQRLGMPADYDVSAHTSLEEAFALAARAAYSSPSLSLLGEQPNFSL